MQYTSRSHGTLLPDFSVNAKMYWRFLDLQWIGFFQIHRIVANTVSEIIFSPWVFF
jgi:hypothetical protein